MLSAIIMSVIQWNIPNPLALNTVCQYFLQSWAIICIHSFSKWNSSNYSPIKVSITVWVTSWKILNLFVANAAKLKMRVTCMVNFMKNLKYFWQQPCKTQNMFSSNFLNLTIFSGPIHFCCIYYIAKNSFFATCCFSPPFLGGRGGQFFFLNRLPWPRYWAYEDATW